MVNVASYLYTFGIVGYNKTRNIGHERKTMVPFSKGSLSLFLPEITKKGFLLWLKMKK